MKTRILSVVLVGLALTLLFLPGGQAQAGIQPVLLVDNVFTAISSGDVDTAVSAFAEDAVVENSVRNETYVGTEEIRQVLQAMQRERRQFDIVWVEMIGDTITFSVEISDRGIAWGLQTFQAEIKDGKVKNLETQGIRLTF